jgi:hypothetical protein
MKKPLPVILLPLILLFSVSAVKAQVSFGVKGGLSFYNFTGSAVKDLGLNQSRSLKPGLIVGVISEIRLSKLFTLQPGLLYSQEGNYQKSGGDKSVYNFNYLNIPVMLQYRDRSGFFGETGPQWGYLLSSSNKTTSGDVTSETSITDQSQKQVFSWAIGCGWMFRTRIGINARSSWGLSSIFKGQSNLTNSGFNATVFYLFGR